MSDGCLCPLLKRVVRDWFPHRQPAPCCPWNTNGSLSRGQEKGINTDSPWHPKNGGDEGSSASVDKARTLDSSAASAALLRGYISSQKRSGFFPLKKELWNHLPYIQNYFLMFEVLRAHIVRKITQWVLQHSPIPRNYRLIDSLVMGKGSSCSKVIFIANFPVQLMYRKCETNIILNFLRNCAGGMLFLSKRIFAPRQY